MVPPISKHGPSPVLELWRSKGVRGWMGLLLMPPIRSIPETTQPFSNMFLFATSCALFFNAHLLRYINVIIILVMRKLESQRGYANCVNHSPPSAVALLYLNCSMLQQRQIASVCLIFLSSKISSAVVEVIYNINETM